MLIKIEFNEIREFLKKKADKDIKIKYTSPSSVVIDYIIDIDLFIKSLNNDLIVLGFQMNKMAEMMAKGQIMKIFEKIDANMINIDFASHQININLSNVPFMQKFLEDFIISSIGFDTEGLNLQLALRK